MEATSDVHPLHGMETHPIVPLVKVQVASTPLIQKKKKKKNPPGKEGRCGGDPPVCMPLPNWGVGRGLM